MKPTATIPGAQARPQSARQKRIGLGVAALTLAALLAVFDVRAMLREWLGVVERLGAMGALLFGLIYVAATVLLVPGSALTLGAGLLFGVPLGSLIVSLASTLGAACSFLIARFLAREWVARKIEANSGLAAMDRSVAAEGWKIVLLLRLSPVFPFSLLNYALGLTRVKLCDYVLASWLGMMPGTVMYVYLGSLARTGASTQEKSPAEWALYGTGLLATLAVTLMTTRIARRSLAKRALLNI